MYVLLFDVFDFLMLFIFWCLFVFGASTVSHINYLASTSYTSQEQTATHEIIGKNAFQVANKINQEQEKKDDDEEDALKTCMNDDDDVDAGGDKNGTKIL